MARIPMWFGTEEQLKCLPGVKRFDLRAADGIQNVCYAAKIKKESFVLPYKVSLDGYVFAIDGNSYFEADPEDIAYFHPPKTCQLPYLCMSFLQVNNSLVAYSGPL